MRRRLFKTKEKAIYQKGRRAKDAGSASRHVENTLLRRACLVVTSLGQSRATRQCSDHLSREVTRMVPGEAWFSFFLFF